MIIFKIFKGIWDTRDPIPGNLTYARFITCFNDMYQYQMGCHPFRNVLSAVAGDHTEMNSISSITSRRNTDKAAAL